jgi:hypothetical protein
VPRPSRRGRLAAALIGLALCAGPSAARGQEPPPEYFEEPREKPHLTLQWDFLARYDNISHLEYYPSISRGRFELRPEVDFVASSVFRIGVRGSFNYGTEPNVDNALYQDNYVSRGAYLDRYYVLWTPGAALSYVDQLGPSSSLTFTAAGIYSAQHYADESILGVGQVLWKSGEESRFAVQASASFWNMDMRNVAPQYYRENRLLFFNGKVQYRSKFELLDTLVKFQFPVAGLPVTVSLDFVHNFGIVGTGPNAYEAALSVGSVGTPRTWRAFFVYQNIGRDALVGAYNTDDWWWHTWAEGYRFGLSYTILPMLYVQPAVVFQRRLDASYWINRVTVDLVKMF